MKDLWGDSLVCNGRECPDSLVWIISNGTIEAEENKFNKKFIAIWTLINSSLFLLKIEN